MFRYKIEKNNVHIEDSYLCEKYQISYMIHVLRSRENSDVWQRNDFSLKTEWYCHNFLYRVGIFRSRTKDVDLNCPQKWWEKIVYPVFGIIAYIFIR